MPPTANDVQACASALVGSLGVDERTALRFAIARNGDAQKAEKMCKSDLEWRAATKPEQIQQGDVMKVLASGHWRLLGKTSTDGFAVLFCSLAYWDPTAYDAAYYGRFVTYFIEAMLRIGERFVVLLDFKGWRLWHGFHIRKIFALISTLQDHYPERLEAAVLTRVPSIFQATWVVAKTFIDANTASKIHFTANSPEAEKEEISRWGAWEVWPAMYGGPATDAVPVPNVPGEADVDGAPSLNPEATPLASNPTATDM